MLLLGIFLGGHPRLLPAPVRSVLVSHTQGRLFDEALDVIAGEYYKGVSRNQLLDQSLKGAVASLNDRFSNYFDPRSYQHFEEATSGEFEGVGMNVDAVARGLRVVTVFAGSPARRAGLRAGDLITAVDGRSLAGRNVNQATALIKGPAGTGVRLTIMRHASARVVVVTRARVNVPVVRGELRHLSGLSIAHVTLDSFTSGAGTAVDHAVRRLLGRGAKGVVLDLRGNGGGLLTEAVGVASVFIPDGTVVSTRGRARPARVFEATGTAISGSIPVAVLVDGNSASASEIVTGALQDRKRATVVGAQTYGKGVFQEITPLSNGGALDLTVGEYFTPSGRNLGPRGGQRGGIRPDVVVPEDRRHGDDRALKAALRAVARGAA